MEEFGWIPVVGTRTGEDITKLGYNLHSYFAWLFLHLKHETFTKRNGRDAIYDSNIVFEWTPYVLGRNPTRYTEILGTIQNLIQRDIIISARVEYIAFEGREDTPTIYKSHLLDKESMETRIDSLAINYPLYSPELQGLRLHLDIDDAKIIAFVDECIANWKGGKLYHYRYDLFPPKKQKEIVLQKLREKYDSYEHTAFVLDLSELPNEVDGFCVLFVLDRAGIIRLHNARKSLESSDMVPRSFYVSILKTPKDQAEGSDKKDPPISFDCDAGILRFQNTAVSLGEMNDAFITTFFDLCDYLEIGVPIDELADGIDGAVENMGAKDRKRAEKRLVYDRIDPLNKKIEGITGIQVLFRIKDRRVGISDPSLVKMVENRK